MFCFGIGWDLKNINMSQKKFIHKKRPKRKEVAQETKLMQEAKEKFFKHYELFCVMD